VKLETVKQEKIILGLIDNYRFLRAGAGDLVGDFIFDNKNRMEKK